MKAQPIYISTRTRIAICLLTVTGIRIGELLSLTVGQLETLLEEGWISIDRLKRGPANHKAFLTPEGKRIIKLRKRDFEFLSQLFSHQNQTLQAIVLVVVRFLNYKKIPKILSLTVKQLANGA